MLLLHVECFQPFLKLFNIVLGFAEPPAVGISDGRPRHREAASPKSSCVCSWDNKMLSDTYLIIMEPSRISGYLSYSLGILWLETKALFKTNTTNINTHLLDIVVQ